MKKIKLAILLAGLSFAATAQNFNKGSMSADIQTGIDIYNTQYTTHIKTSSFDTTIISTDRAGCKSISLSYEYEVIKRLGVGARVKFNNYFVSKDSITGTTPSVKSQDYMLTLNYHLIDKNKFDLGAGISFGGSHLLYKMNNKAKDIITGSGTYFQFQVNPRFIIKKKVGLGIAFYSPIVNYTKMTTSIADFNEFAFTKWKGSGTAFSFTLSYLISTK